MAGLPRPGDDEQVEEHLRNERLARHDFWRDLRRTATHLALSVGAGLLLIGWSWHTADTDLGHVLWLAGQTVWLSGVLWSLLGAYRRGHARGDW